ncbi:MAG: plasmid pRiA4b ORF-3 family protein, partial [Dehalococcoidales bacterium]|nr:plasmid pRiA4b ORF-3 family protein [Dehalococcoidales bacterium]
MAGRKNIPKKINETVYQIKVTLKESKPLIWRRVQVPGSVTLHRLHMILQYVMGWTNSHLYRFDIAGTEYSLPDPDGELHFVDSRRNRLNKVVSMEKTGFLYEYDFGDGWNHEILIEKILPAESAGQYP